MKIKIQMLEDLLKNENIPFEETIYIGDKYSDFITANKNKITFIGADWGDSKISNKMRKFLLLKN